MQEKWIEELRVTDISNCGIMRSLVIGGLFLLFFLGCPQAQDDATAVRPPTEATDPGNEQPSQAASVPRLDPEIPEPYLMLEPGSGLSVRARSSVLMEYTTGKILQQQNKDEMIPPASFAKMLTLYVVFDLIEKGQAALVDEVFISEKAWRTGGSKMFVREGERVPLEESIKGIAVVSGNDSCVAVAEHFSGSEEAFVKVMNETAAGLGMTKSHFTNSHGLPSRGQVTTAHDMALLAVNYLRDFPGALQYHSMTEYTFSDIRQFNRNRLLRRDETVDGLKTGYTAASGYHLLSTARREGRRLISVLMGAATASERTEESAKLLNYGYRRFAFVDASEELGAGFEIPVFKGQEDSVSVVADSSPMLILPDEFKDQLDRRDTLPEHLIAPVQHRQLVGEYVVALDGRDMATIDLVADRSVDRAGIGKVLNHSFQLLDAKQKKLYRWAAVVIAVLILGRLYIAYLRYKRRRRRSRFRLARD
jgi:D-alanyl-D-alanine carboxypeptidase (penicillin-binding protein 5/6)